MIGENLQKVRTARKLSLRQLGALIQERGFVSGLSYSAIQRIEAGERKVATHELAELAEVLETSMATLIGTRDRSASLSLAARVAEQPADQTLSVVKLRAVEVLEAQDLLERLVEPLSKVERPSVSRVPLSRGGGKLLARHLRNVLGLGSAPIADLAVLVEEMFGALVFKEPLPPGASGFCAVDEEAAVMLINSEDSPGRQNFTLAHELCHLMMRDVEAFEIVGAELQVKSTKEARADAFAANFLAPDDGLRSALNGGKATGPQVARLAHRFSMSLEAMTIRLRDLGLLAADAENELQGGRRQLAEISGLMGDTQSEEFARGGRRPSRRLTEQAVSAFHQGVVGIGLVSTVTGIRDLDELRTLLGGAETMEGDRFQDSAHLA